MLQLRQRFSSIREGQGAVSGFVDVAAVGAVDFPALVNDGGFSTEHVYFELVLPVPQGVALPALVCDCEGFRDVGRFSGGSHGRLQ